MIPPTKGFALAAAILAASIPHAFSQVPPTPAVAASSERLAREVVANAFGLRSTSEEANRRAFTDSYLQNFNSSFTRDPRVAEMLKARPELGELVTATVRRALEGQYEKVVVPALETALADLYVARFSRDELAELAAYHRTPEARRFLQSFTAAEAERNAAQSDPVVVRFRGSALGQKERALSSDIAQTMIDASIAAGLKVNEVVVPELQSALRAALARPRVSK